MFYVYVAPCIWEPALLAHSIDCSNQVFSIDASMTFLRKAES